MRIPFANLFKRGPGPATATQVAELAEQVKALADAGKNMPSQPDMGQYKVDSSMFEELGTHELLVGLQGLLVDPDTLGPETWDSMNKDAQVKACDLVITLPITRMDWHLAAETERGKQIAAWVEKALHAMDDTPHYYLRQALTSLRYGRAAAELVWRQENDLILLTKMKFYHPSTWVPKVDEKKHLVGVVQRTGTAEVLLKTVTHKVALFVHEKEFGNWYGRTLYRASHKPWVEKEFGTRMWNVAMEKFASPFMAGKVPQGGDLGTMLAIINGIKSKAGVALPPGYELEVKEAARSGLSYLEYLGYKDKQIARGMFVPDLIFANDSTGSYSLGDSQANFFIMREDAISDDLADVLTKYVVRPIVAYNFPDAKAEDYPVWKFAGLTKENKKDLAEIVKTMIEGNVVEPDEKWIRDRLGLPPAEDEAKKKLRRLGLNQATALKAMLDSGALKKNDVRTLIFGLDADPELDKPAPAPAPFVPGQLPGQSGGPGAPGAAGQDPAKPGEKPDKTGQMPAKAGILPDKTAAGESDADVLDRLHADLASILRIGK